MRFSSLCPKLSSFGLAASVLCALVLGGCRTDLNTKLDEQQTNEIVSTLLRHHIYATRSAREDNTFAVTVDEADFAKAVQILKEKGLPKPSLPSLCDIFKKDSLVSSPTEERARYICGLSLELSKTVSGMNGVLLARVHIVLPENDPLRQQSTPSSASVFIQHQASVPIADRIPQIKMLIANGIAGLTYDKVSISLDPVESAPETESDELVLFWGLWIKKESTGWASWLLYGLTCSVIGLASILGYVLWRTTQKVYRLPVAAEAKAR
jgi:type III secretion protein J